MTMGKPKKNKIRPVSKATRSRSMKSRQQRRLKMLTRIVHDTVGKHLSIAGVEDIVFLVVHGPGPNNSQIVAQSHFDNETALMVLGDDFKNYADWG
jgi:hypothetical protein